jgi:hypothetical protein
MIVGRVGASAVSDLYPAGELLLLLGCSASNDAEGAAS